MFLKVSPAYFIIMFIFMIIPIRNIVKRCNKKSSAAILDRLLDGECAENDYYKQLPYFHTVRYI